MASDDPIEAEYKIWCEQFEPEVRFPRPTRADRVSEFDMILPKIEQDDELFEIYLRMKRDTFYYILRIVSEKLDVKLLNFFSQPVTAEEQLVITLRYLATGYNFRLLGASFKISSNTVESIIDHVCKVLWGELTGYHMPYPTTDRFRALETKLYAAWGLPNCIGAIDMTLLPIRHPDGNQSSLMFQGVVDHKSRFICFDVGCHKNLYNVAHDDDMRRLIAANKLEIPPPKQLPLEMNIIGLTPHMFVTDGKYQLGTSILSPNVVNGEQIKGWFNDGVRDATNCSKKAFLTLYDKWPILNNTDEFTLHYTHILVRAMCVLHNTIVDREGLTPALL